MKQFSITFGEVRPPAPPSTPPKPQRNWLGKLTGVFAAALLLIGGYAYVASTDAASLTADERYQICLNKVEALFPVRPYSADNLPAIALLGYNVGSYQTGLQDFDAVTLKNLGLVTCTIEYHEIIGGGTDAQRAFVDKYETTAWAGSLVSRILLDRGRVVGSPETVLLGSDRHVKLAEIGALPSSLDEFIAFVDGMAFAYNCYPNTDTDANGNPVFPADCATANEQLPRPASLPVPPV